MDKEQIYQKIKAEIAYLKNEISWWEMPACSVLPEEMLNVVLKSLEQIEDDLVDLV